MFLRKKSCLDNKTIRWKKMLTLGRLAGSVPRAHDSGSPGRKFEFDIGCRVYLKILIKSFKSADSVHVTILACQGIHINNKLLSGLGSDPVLKDGQRLDSLLQRIPWLCGGAFLQIKWVSVFQFDRSVLWASGLGPARSVNSVPQMCNSRLPKFLKDLFWNLITFFFFQFQQLLFLWAVCIFSMLGSVASFHCLEGKERVVFFSSPRFTTDQ